MTILELEQKTQLDRATIRFYEKEGLIAPKRKENRYRDYSEEDAEEILKIKLLRQLDLPICSIKQLQADDANIADVLRMQAATLENKITEASRAVAVCKEISASKIRYSNLNASEYLDKLQEETASPELESQANVPYERNVQYIEYHPVRRFVARMIDYILLDSLVRFFFIVILKVRPFTELLSNIIHYGCLLFSVPLQAFMIRYLATTPGKWLMGIRVQAYNGKKMDIDNAMLREWQALFYGYGLGIPFIRLWRLWRSYKLHKKGEALQEDIGVEHVYSDWNVLRKSAFAIICAFILLISCTNGMDAIKPKHRGNELTIAQFAENYNYYSELFEYSFTMNPDGTWYIPTGDNPSNVVIINPVKPERNNEPFRFVTEGERIQKITYQNSWTDVSFLTPIDKKIVVACCTALASQTKINGHEIINGISYLNQYADNHTAYIALENIEIRWTITSINCHNANGTYIAKDQTKESSVTLYFEIIIH